MPRRRGAFSITFVVVGNRECAPGKGPPHLEFDPEKPGPHRIAELFHAAAILGRGSRPRDNRSRFGVG